MYNTLKGEFNTLAELRHAYLKSGEHIRLDPGHTGGDEWESGKLHASEVSFCPRATMLRLLGAEKRKRASLTEANEALMFWVAYRIHYLTYEALDWAGILVEHEYPVLQGVWAGRVDAIIRPDVESRETLLYDAKTVRPNAMKYSESFPKPDNCIQMGVYGTVRDEEEAIIEYIDRGGSNPPVECVVKLDRWVSEAAERMDLLAAYRERIEGSDLKTALLPPILPESFVPHYRKVPNENTKDLVSVTYDCAWQCNWCDFHHTDPDTGRTRLESPCRPPNHPPIEVAKRLPKKAGGGWQFTVPKAVESEFETWMADQPRSVPAVGGE